MSRDADILFCKIAMTHGMVSPQQAQKVLALLDKREAETGRRPIVAAVFTKNKLMTTEQAQQIKAAVAKRLGQAVPVPPPVASRGSAARRRRREKAPKRPVDQQTLMMGAGFGVVFVGVLITICYLYLVGGGSEVSSSGTSPSTPSVSPDGSPGSGLGRTAQDDVPPLPEELEKELPREIIGEINTRLGDIQIDRIDNPARARTSLLSLKSFIEERRSQGYTIPVEIDTRLREVEDGLAAMAAEAEVDDSAGVGEEPAPVVDTEAEAETSVEEEPAAEEEDESLDDLDLDDLDLDDLGDLDDF